MKPIAASIIICAGVYLLVSSPDAGDHPPLEAIGYATMTIGAWLMFVGWSDQKATEKRFWLSFGVRDLFWLMLMAAILTAWWLDHRSLALKITQFGAQSGGGGGGGGF